MKNYLNNLAEEIYQNNRKKGFYEDSDKLSAVISDNAPELLGAFKGIITGQRLALITSEVSETLEADRHNKSFTEDFQKNLAHGLDPLRWKKEFLEEIDDNAYKQRFLLIKDTKEDEIADVIIRCLDFCGANNIDIDFHVQAKLKFNKLRAYKHGKNY